MFEEGRRGIMSVVEYVITRRAGVRDFFSKVILLSLMITQWEYRDYHDGVPASSHFSLRLG